MRGLRETVTIGPKCLWANGRPRNHQNAPQNTESQGPAQDSLREGREIGQGDGSLLLFTSPWPGKLERVKLGRRTSRLSLAL